MSTLTLNKTNKLSLKKQTFAAGCAVVMAVALPQIFHLMGALSGLGTSLGEIFLPMHLPIILAGLLAGPYAAGIAGAFAPLLSFLLTGMPNTMMLPFMVIELSAYGVSAGLLRKKNIPTFFKVVISQLVGRFVRAAAILVAVYGFASPISVSVIWKSVGVGIMGLALQWLLLPLIVYRLEGGKAK